MDEPRGPRMFGLSKKMQILSVILLSALCILANAKVVMRISNSVGDGKNAKFYYCRHFMKPSKSERPASIKFESIYPKVEETVKVTSTRLPRRLTASLRLCWRLKLSKTLDLPKGHYKVQYLNAAGDSIGLESSLHSSIIINREREPPKPAPYVSNPAPSVYLSDFQKELMTYNPKKTKFRSITRHDVPTGFPRQEEFISAMERGSTFKIVDTVYTDLAAVGEEKGRNSVTAFAKGPRGIDVVIKGVNPNEIHRMTQYVDERETLFKLGRLLQYDDLNLFLVTPRIFGVSLTGKIKTAQPSDYHELLDSCLVPILELNKFGVAQRDLNHAGNFIIDDQGKCHAIDFGQIYKLIDGTNQQDSYTIAFNMWWDYAGIFRPFYPFGTNKFYPSPETDKSSQHLIHHVRGNYISESGEIEVATLSICKRPRFDPSQYFSFTEDGLIGFNGDFPVFDNLLRIHDAVGDLMASDAANKLILTRPIRGSPLTNFPVDKAKEIWTETIARLHKSNILVGYISSDNIVVDEEGIGHLKVVSYSLMLEKPFIGFGPNFVREKMDLEMEFLQYIHDHCPISGNANPRICHYKPMIKYLAVGDHSNIMGVIEGATHVFEGCSKVAGKNQ